jgi:hypothetical protein
VTTNALATSGELIAIFLDAFGGPGDLPSPIVDMLRDRTSRRVFTGGSSRRWCCRLSALQLLLWKRGLLALPKVMIASEERSMALFSMTVAKDLILWDELVRASKGRRAYLRYFAVDASARLFGLLDERARSSELFAPRPAWAERARHGEPLRALLGPSAPGRTNAEHAEKLGFTPSVLSSWKTGKARPPLDAIDVLAKYVGKHDGRGGEFVGKMLHWHYALSSIAGAIADLEGERFAMELATVFAGSLACMARRVGAEGATKVSSGAKLHLLCAPLWKLPSEMRDTVIGHVREHAGGDEWQREVREVCAEFEAVRDPDAVVRQKMPRHPHPFWRLPKRCRHP